MARRTKHLRWCTAAVLTSVAIVAWDPGVASAATFTVTTASDTVAADGVTSLREAFIASSLNGTDDVIVLDAVTYSLTRCADGPLLSDGDEQLTIQGNGATISQTCSDVGMIEMTGLTSVLIVDGVTLEGGPNTGTTVTGAAINSQGNIILDRVTITGVDGGPGGSVVNAEYAGGAVPYTIQVLSSTITGNDNTAIVAEFASVLVQDSTISINNGSGVSLVDGSPLVITSSAIIDNVGRGARTTGQGSTTMTVTDSTISRNGRGGLDCSACEMFTITSSVITDNGGGATAGFGGGVSMAIDQDDVNDIPRLTITGSDISRNRAVRSGGGVNVDVIESIEPLASETIVSILNSTIDENWTEGNAVPGGGINIEIGSLQIGNSTVSSNEAGRFGTENTSSGGGIHMTRGVLDDVVGYDLQFGGVTIDGNIARGSGGGMHVFLDGRYEIEQMTVSANTAGGVGGGAVIRGTGSIVQSSIEGNDGTEGGGLWLDRGGSAVDAVYVTSTTIAGNIASIRGGGAYLHKADVTFENVTVTGNSAPRGGGIHVGEDPMGQSGSHVLDHVTLAGNTAPVGANLAFDIGDLTIRRSIVAEPLGGGSNCDLLGYVPTSGGWSYLTDSTCAAGVDDTVAPASPQLGPLAANGGPTRTKLLGVGSPAGGLVPVAQCGAPVDQRGVARPAGAACDPGATEVVETAVSGTAKADTLMGDKSANVLRGLAGDDIVDGKNGDDVLDGGAGDDRVLGGPGDDLLIGGPGRDRLDGGQGRDTLIGDGNDVLVGGPGVDRCFKTPTSRPADC